MMRSAILWLVLVAGGAHAADKSKPHPHTGKIKPFKLGKPDVTLKASEVSKVDAGEMFIAQSMSADGLSGRSTAVQSIAAPPNTIWDQLLDFNAYPAKVDKLNECKIYEDKPKGMGNRQLKVMMKIAAAPGFNYEYYCDHTYSAKEKSLIWTLDYERDSDFDDVTGHWYVCPHPEKENWSQVYYSADLKLKGWVPKFILNILTTTAIKSAVTWVKRESEEDWKKNGAAAAGGGGGFPKMPSFGPFAKAPPPPVAAPVALPPKKMSVKKLAGMAGSVGLSAAAAVVAAVKISEIEE